MPCPCHRYAHPRDRGHGRRRRKKKVAEPADAAVFARGSEASSPPPGAATVASPESFPSAIPAPFLKTLKPQPAAPPAVSTALAADPVASRKSAATPPSGAEEPDTAADSPISDESFESATTVVPRSALVHRDVERDADAAPLATLRPPPSLEEMVAKVPEETRKALEEIFRARFRAVRRITPDQLR